MKIQFRTFIQEKRILLIGLGISTFIAIYFVWVKIQEQSEIFIKELEQIKKSIEKAAKFTQNVNMLIVDQEMSRNEQGLEFTIRLVRSSQFPRGDISKDPFMAPFENGIFIQQLGNNHNLLLNKYPIYANHTLLVTKQFQPQEGLNTLQDLYNTYKVMRAVQGFAIFNSCVEAGATMPHKHFQILPQSAFNECDLLKYVTRFLRQEREGNNLKDCYRLSIYKHINHYVRPILTKDVPLMAEQLYTIYISLLKDLSQQLTNQPLKYNLIMTPQFMMIVHRKKGKFNQTINLNSFAFLGSILVRTMQELKDLEEIKLVQMLEDVCELMPQEENKPQVEQNKWSWI